MSRLPVRKAEAAREVWLMRQQGKSNEEISEELSLPPAQVANIVSSTLAKASNDLDGQTRHELLSMELSRLDALQQSLWQAALAGDTRSVDTVLKIIDKRTKLLGLEQQTETQATVQTVVVTGNQDSYLEALRTIASGGDNNG